MLECVHNQSQSDLTKEDLQLLIKSSGFYKAKAQTILTILTWLNRFDFDYARIQAHYGKQLRKSLLELKGIGNCLCLSLIKAARFNQ